MWESIKLKKELFRAWLAGKYGEAADRRSRRAAARSVTEAKTLVWEEFGEAMEKDIHWASRGFGKQLDPVCAEPEEPTVNLERRCSWAVEGAL